MSAVHATRRPRPASSSHPAAQPAQPRGNGLAQIHIAKKQLGMNEDTYRAMLWGVARVHSAADLDHAGRAKVLAHLKASGFKSRPPTKPTPGRPRNMDHPTRGPMLGKVEALLLDAGRPWAYAHEMAKHMFKVDALDFCHEGQLHDLVAALEVDKRRRNRNGPQA